MNSQDAILHATAVAIGRHGVLIIGPSGAGKSSLALQLIALGAELVADDRTCVARVGDTVIASVPDTIVGLIEARGVGLIPVGYAGQTPLRSVIDLEQLETKRLPDDHSHIVLGLALPCLHKIEAPHFASAIMLYIKAKQGA